MTLIIATTLIVLLVMFAIVVVTLGGYLLLRTRFNKAGHHDPSEATDLDYPSTRGHLFKGLLGFNKKWHNR